MTETQTQQPPAPTPRMPLVERVIKLEDALTELITRHNAFIDTVVRELGL